MPSSSELETIAVFLRHHSVSCWQMTPAQGQLLEELMPGYRVVLCAREEDFVKQLNRASIAITWQCRQDWLDQAAKLRILATPAAGKDYFTVALPPGVIRLNGQFHGELIAETAVGAILAMFRGILPAVSQYAAAPWPRPELSPRIRPLRGSRIGILGFGHIGQAIGALLKPFGVHITGFRKNPQSPAPDWFVPGEDACFGPSELDQVLPTLEHIVLAMPRSADTDNILDARRLALLPRHASISNFGRGNAIELPALLQALRSGQLSGAFLDVFPREPLDQTDAELLSCPNLWRLPHLSAAADHYLDLFIRDFVRQYRLCGSGR
ncbi:MAG: hydroxyacid dehydrogenase [Oligosphaeraceae bacterium]|nr:hydroxyacid dehydrogenase [Oligosphaeraceae bacterium]